MRSALQGCIDLEGLEQALDEALDERGEDPADGEDDKGYDQVRHEAHYAVPYALERTRKDVAPILNIHHKIMC